MRAGRELDSLIAEKVMGWTIATIGIGWPPGTDEPARSVPDYSSDIVDAWELLEKLHMTVYAPHAPYASQEYQNGPRWRAEAMTDRWASIEVADTGPLAICLTALRLAEIVAEHGGTLTQ